MVLFIENGVAAHHTRAAASDENLVVIKRHLWLVKVVGLVFGGL